MTSGVTVDFPLRGLVSGLARYAQLTLGGLGSLPLPPSVPPTATAPELREIDMPLARQATSGSYDDLPRVSGAVDRMGTTEPDLLRRLSKSLGSWIESAVAPSIAKLGMSSALLSQLQSLRTPVGRFGVDRDGAFSLELPGFFGSKGMAPELELVFESSGSVTVIVSDPATRQVYAREASPNGIGEILRDLKRNLPVGFGLNVP